MVRKNSSRIWFLCHRRCQAGYQKISIGVKGYYQLAVSVVPEDCLECPAEMEFIIDRRTVDIGGFEVRRALPFHEKRLVVPFVKNISDHRDVQKTMT